MSDNVDDQLQLSKPQVFHDHQFTDEEGEVLQQTFNLVSNSVTAFINAQNPAGAASACYLLSRLLSTVVAENNLDPACLEDVRVDERGLIAELDDLHVDEGRDLDGGGDDAAAADAANAEPSDNNALAKGSGLTHLDPMEIGGNLTCPKITIRIPFATGMTAADYRDAMDEFKIWLTGRTTQTLVKRTKLWVCLADNAMDSVCRVIFEQMTSQPALHRFNKILNETLREDDGEGAPSLSLIAGARRTLLDKAKPKEIRLLAISAESYWTMQQQQKSETRAFETDVKGVSMYSRYTDLEKGVQNNPVYWRTVFNDAGIPRGRGIDMQSRLQRYMAHCFGVEKEILMDRFRNVRPLWEMVRMNSAGILILLPRDAVRVLRRAAGAFWVDILLEFNRKFPEFRRLCLVLNQHVVKPLISGRIEMLPKTEVHTKVQGSTMTSVFERLLNACEPQGRIETEDEDGDQSMQG